VTFYWISKRKRFVLTRLQSKALRSGDMGTIGSLGLIEVLTMSILLLSSTYAAHLDDRLGH